MTDLRNRLIVFNTGFCPLNHPDWTFTVSALAKLRELHCKLCDKYMLWTELVRSHQSIWHGLLILVEVHKVLVVSCGCINSQSGEHSEQEASGVTCTHTYTNYKDLSETSSDSPQYSNKWYYFLNVSFFISALILVLIWGLVHTN